MKKKLGFCDYYNHEFVNKYKGLSYQNYHTEIVGNTFYIFAEYGICDGLILKRKRTDRVNIAIIPMIKTQEETIRDVLRAWNFGEKYEWLYEDLKG